MTRFCRAIGLDSYQHLLIELAQERGRGEVSDWGSAEIGPDISPDDSLERVVQVVGSADLRAIQQTIERIDLDALERAAQALAKARRIDVYGVGGSGAVAQETETRLFRIGCQVRGWTEVHGAATSAALLTPADVAIGISHSGATRETLEPFETAKERARPPSPSPPTRAPRWPRPPTSGSSPRPRRPASAPAASAAGTPS